VLAVDDRLIELSDPDIPEAHWRATVAIRRQLNWCGRLHLVERLTNVARLAPKPETALHKHAVEEDRDVRRSFQ
jgi:hypothetical protein